MGFLVKVLMFFLHTVVFVDPVQQLSAKRKKPTLSIGEEHDGKDCYLDH